MKLSRNGARLIESFEGFVSKPYKDAVGVWTIGYGSTAGVGPNTPPMTRAQAEARMMREVDQSYGAAVNALRLPFNQNQFDALVSFTYNVGTGGIGANTKVGQFLRAHQYGAAADALLAWDKAGGRPLAGLTRRRHAERALFLKAMRPKASATLKPSRTVRPRPKYVLIDGCPCPYDIAPYVHRVLRKAGQKANSIYRGDDAATLLHANGKRTQREIHADPALMAISNPPGFSSHELRGDGTVGARGRVLPSWRVGVDSGTNTPADVRRIEQAAKSYGWAVVHPYARGVEAHHWNFARQPKAKNPVQRAHLALLRARLPRK